MAAKAKRALSTYWKLIRTNDGLLEDRQSQYHLMLFISTILLIAASITSIFNIIDKDIAMLFYSIALVVTFLISHLKYNEELKQSVSEVEYKDTLLHMSNDVARILLTVDEKGFENSLYDAMELIAGCLDIDRIYIWQNEVKDGHLHYIQKFEWLSTRQRGKDVLVKTGFAYEDSIPAWETALSKGECVNGTLRSMVHTDQERLKPYGIKSVLVIPVHLRDYFWGFVSIDDCHKERTFTEDEVSILRSANLMLVSMLDRHEAAAKIREADEHEKLMLDAMPLCCNLWNKDLVNINCNEEAVKLFDLRDKKEYLERFFELSPERQPDGYLSTEKVQEYIAIAFREGRFVFNWIHQKLDGTPIPTEITLVRIKQRDDYIVAGYTRDLREHNKMMNAIKYKDSLMHNVNDVAGILLRSETDEFEKDLYRCMGMIAWSVGADRMNIWKNIDKDGQMYCTRLYEWSDGALQWPAEYSADFPYSEISPSWKVRLPKGQCINSIVRNLPPEEQALQVANGVQSILIIPVFLRNQFWGYVGFDDCHKERVFSAEEVSILRSGSLLIANALLRNDMTNDIQAAVAKAQAASEAKSAFLAHMSHEIRTPMNVISGMTELILRENVPTTIYEHVVSVKHASTNMLSLINDVLDFSKIEAGSLEIVLTEYSLTSLINDITIIIRMKVSEKPVLFTTNIDCNIPNWLIGDDTRIRQILLNVLDNAAKYTNEGFISLTVTGEINDDTVVLTAEVSDSGVGIKKEDMSNLFADFARFDSNMNKDVQGTGLGLAITTNLCQAMGGNISVRSEYGAGSTFTITIPQKIKSHDDKFACISQPDTKQVLLYETRPVYADSIVRTFDNLGVSCTLVDNRKEFCAELKRRSYPFVFVSSLLSESVGHMINELEPDTTLILLTEFGEVPAMRNVRSIAMPVHAAAIANALNDIDDSIYYNESGRENVRFIAPSAEILIVDDLNTNLKVAEGLMLPYQMQVDVCESGEESIEYIQKKRYDIIFMDHMMPGMDGIQTVSRIRSLENGSGYYSNVPIIALTANAVSGVKEMFLQKGMNDFLAKPIDVTKLHGLLEKWIPEEKKEKSRQTKAKASEDMDSVQIQIEGVDVQAGIAMTGGMADSYLKTLAIFHMDGSEKINKIRDCVEKNDIMLYTTYVHALKSASATIGAWEVSGLFKALEMAGSREDVEYIRKNTGRTLEKFETLLKNINTVVLANQDEPTKEDDDEFLNDELMKLKDALNNRDAGEIDSIMNTLGTVKWGRQAGDMYKEISKNILFINYKDALILTDELLMG